MMVLVTYDVNTETPEGKTRLRHVAKACKNFGQRVQKSVFECLVDPAQWAGLKNRLLTEIDEKEDSLRFYYMGANWKPHIEQVGANPGYDTEGLLLV